MRKNILNISLLIGAMIVIAVVVSRLFPTPPPPVLKPLPNPNGYHTLVKSTALLPSVTADFERMDHDALLAFVESNTNALQLARSGLSLECQVPLEYSQAFVARGGNNVGRMKQLAQAFAAESRLAEMENRPNDAAKSSLDAIRLGSEIGRGGLLLHEMIGMVVESIGMRQLQRLPGRLDAATSRETVKVLESIDARREPWNDIWERERDWPSRVSLGFRERIAYLLGSGRATKATAAKAATRYNDHVEASRRMMVQFAALAFEQENHRKPKSFADLVPDFLKAIPQDPSTGTNMAFLP